MKKHIILYSVFAIALGIALGAFAIYMIRINLVEMLVGSMGDLGIVALILAFLLFIPILIVRLFLLACILYAILYVSSGIVALISFFKCNLIYLRKILRVFQAVNAMMLFLIVVMDIIIIFLAGDSFMSGIPVPIIIFISLITPLCVALQIIAVLSGRKLKQTIIDERQPR